MGSNTPRHLTWFYYIKVIKHDYHQWNVARKQKFTFLSDCNHNKPEGKVWYGGESLRVIFGPENSLWLHELKLRARWCLTLLLLHDSWEAMRFWRICQVFNKRMRSWRICKFLISVFCHYQKSVKVDELGRDDLNAPKFAPKTVLFAEDSPCILFLSTERNLEYAYALFWQLWM